jgi:NNP family nitrate/nitrite transporter-like MFS transporter
MSDKATSIDLFSLRTPAMRAFHLAWLAFFVCFFAWFACAPLMPMVKQAFGLSSDDVATLNIAAVSITILARLVIGPMCDRYGPRKVYVALMIAGMAPMLGAALAPTYHTFFWCRLAIGAVGASFVITQYQTSVMFAGNVVGMANATTAGWGNAGAGAAQVAVPLMLAAIVALGIREASAWRLTLALSGVAMPLVAWFYWRYGQDCPQGNYAELRARGVHIDSGKKGGWRSLMAAGRNYRVWMLFVAYAASFGVEVFIHNVAAVYYVDHFHLSLEGAGVAAGSFGLLAIVARPLGGWLSDRAASRRGLSVRAWLLAALIIGEGGALLVFSHTDHALPAVLAMLLFGICTHMACGAAYALVPFINREALGGVAGIVGAGGNVGAVAAGFLLKGEGDMGHTLAILGVIVCASSVCVAAMRFKTERVAPEVALTAAN